MTKSKEEILQQLVQAQDDYISLLEEESLTLKAKLFYIERGETS